MVCAHEYYLPNQLGDVVARHQTSPAVQQLGLQVAILVHLSPDQNIVSGTQGQLTLGIIILRLGEWLIGVSGMRKSTIRNGCQH